MPSQFQPAQQCKFHLVLAFAFACFIWAFFDVSMVAPHFDEAVAYVPRFVASRGPLVLLVLLYLALLFFGQAVVGAWLSRR